MIGRAEAEALTYGYAREDLGFFVQKAWSVLEPQTILKWNWHHDLICEHLEAVQLGQIKRLVINVAPRSTKSILSTVCFPDWIWTKEPHKRFLFGSYADSLAMMHSVLRRELILSEWYQRGYGQVFSLSEDSNQKTEFKNNRTGHMRAAGIGGSITGSGADMLILDDPHNPKGAESQKERESTILNFDLAWSTRLNDKKTGAIVIIMQRLHEKDLSGHVLAKNAGYLHLKIPTICEQPTKIIFPLSGRVFERNPGDLMHPERDGPKEIAQAKEDMGQYGFAGQHQQSPAPMEGGLFKREWWQFYEEPPEDVEQIAQFWDCAHKVGLQNDYSVCATWAKTTRGYYLLDIWRKKVEAPQLEQAAELMFHTYKPSAVVIEDKASGIGLIQALRQKSLIPVIAYDPKARDKEVRAIAATPTVQLGKCYLPKGAAWVEGFIDELERFPSADHDDQVDTLSMMVEFFRQSEAVYRVRRL